VFQGTVGRVHLGYIRVRGKAPLDHRGQLGVRLSAAPLVEIVRGVSNHQPLNRGWKVIKRHR